MPDPLLFEGLGALAQGFLAGRRAKQERQRQKQEFEFRQQQALAEANRAERAAKAQEAANQLALLSFGQRAYQEGTAGPGMEAFIRSQLPESLTAITEQRPVGEILPPIEMPTVRPPMQVPRTAEQERALQQLQVINDRLNTLPTLAMPEENRRIMQERLTGEREQMRSLALGEPSPVVTAATPEMPQIRPRGGVFEQPLPIRPAGTIEQRRPAPSLFQAPPVKPLKPEEDPLVQTQKEVELNFRSGRMAPEEMQKYYKLKSEYQRTNNKNAFLQGLQTLSFRERPVTERAGTGAAEQRAKFNLLLGYQDFVHTTEMDNDRIEDNKRAKQKEISDIQEELDGLERSRSARMVTPKEYTERKAEITKRINKANDEIRAFDLKIIKNLKQAQTTTKSMNQLEKEVGLPGEFEARQAEDTRTERVRNFLDEQGYEANDESIKMFLQNNPDFE